MKYPTSYYIKPPQHGGRRLVIGDVHGCAKTLKALVAQLQLTLHDQLFFLGDYIDRGPDSKGVLSFIQSLQQTFKFIFLLRGNHEQMLIDAYYRYKNPKLFKRFLSINQTEDLLNEKGEFPTTLIDFLEKLPFYYELSDCFLVHAGFNLLTEFPLQDFHSMLWIRNFKPYLFENKGLIHGHTPVAYRYMQAQINQKSPAISIDNGCVFYQLPRKNFAKNDLGRLCCLDLDTFVLYTQENIDERKA